MSNNALYAVIAVVFGIITVAAMIAMVLGA